MGKTQNIAIAIVSNRLIKPQTVLSLLQLKTKHHLTPIIATEGYTIAEGRNYCVFQALKAGCSHILFIDDDMTFPTDTIERLLAHQQPIVGVYSYSRSLPLRPTVGFMDTDGALVAADRTTFLKRPSELFECYSVGMGVALIDLSIFKTLPQPWFKFITHESGKVLVGEDAYLCVEARKQGFKTFCDPSLEVGHIGDYSYGPEETAQRPVIDYFRKVTIEHANG